MRRRRRMSISPRLGCQSKNHVKQYGESLRMRPKQVQSNAQNKPPTQTLQEAFSHSTPYGKESQRWKEITAAVTTYVCKDMAPIYTVEKRGFRELVLTLDPRQDPNTSEVAMTEDGTAEQFEFQYGLEGPTFKNENENGECSKSHLSIIKVEQLDPLLPDQNNSSCGSGSPGDPGPPGLSGFGSSMSPAAQFFRKCHQAGCIQLIFSEFSSRLNIITERISSQQASEEDFNLTLKVLEASGMLPEIFAKRDQEMEKRLKDLQRETEAVRTARSAMRDACVMSFTPS
ncbi:uncharacterized protein LOC129816752 isoform X5 [Salvelinus fontinalis]|uniref:uncharacterized protein LOC129816752 isoform X5 n=1 Tax=Salvelinus fontinalis TaxID=8038 RepID=UPI0024857F74|nr:uncharacterized protein LOC129816752 isoform X5 [Salvelinus fontinalis]XP_055727576.1 uncharacterized protein LOC129816752 isoform X5 [Salvelinus fontinalis]XP_055727577.1 uncharacterized protein LOC129816752 isoform X5 [Salvelinus fontinalis]